MAVKTRFLTVLVAVGCGTQVDGVTADAGNHPDAQVTIDAQGSGGDGTIATPDAPATGADAMSMSGDVDGDGLDDVVEMQLAHDYMPFVSLDPADGCPLGGMLVRVHPHPMNPAYVHIIYDHLYQNDCGLGGHVGDDEVFAITVDPTKIAPLGIIAVKAISHQNTPCERTTECGSCPGMTLCATATRNGAPYPVVYASKDKHGDYALLSTCQFGSCFDVCTLATASDEPLMVNAGEPTHHLTENLTTDGFVTAANGWTEPSLMNFNPWMAGAMFGTAGVVADDLVDPAFDTQVCP